MHWADVEAGRLTNKGPGHVIATGITPSGDIHVGNMREILTGDTVYRALREKLPETRLLYVGDTFDPLRKVYPFLPENYSEHVGKPLSRIPCPCGSHESYAEHFLQPFLEALEQLGVGQETVKTHEMYANGEYAEVIGKVLDNVDAIRKILEEGSGREMPGDWSPYVPLCHECGRFDTTKVTGHAYPYVDYTCECGHQGKADVRKAEGKLPWRVEWPARWFHLGVTCEPFGKDHAAAGGSYQTGAAIIRDVLGREPPHPVVYEWIQLKGQGAMSSSKGVAVSAVQMLNMTPPEVLRYLVIRSQPGKHLDFDPGLGILKLVDEYDQYERVYFGKEELPAGLKEDKLDDWKRVYVLSQPGAAHENMPYQVPYRHFVSLAQIKEEWPDVLELVKRAEGMESLAAEDEAYLKRRWECVRYWLDNYAPDMVKFSIKKEMPHVELGSAEKQYLRALAEKLVASDWSAEQIHNIVHETGKAAGLSSKASFKVLYRIMLDSSKGPRLGYFLHSLERDFVLGRMKEAAQH